MNKLIFLSLFFCMSCVTTSGPVQLSAHEGAWSSLVKEHTRQDEYYTYALREADVRATLVTPSLRKAFIEARDDFSGKPAQDFADEVVALGSSPDEGVDGGERKPADAESQIIIYVSMYVTQQKYRDLAASYTQWDAFLERGKTRAKPLSIERVRFSPGLKEILPHADRFDDIYILRFPLFDEGGKAMFDTSNEDALRLHLKSAVAELKVEWTLLD